MKDMLKNLLLIHLCFLSGCIGKSIEELFLPKIHKTRTHHEVLSNNHLENLTVKGKLGERAFFIALLPLYLIKVGNFIEKNLIKAQVLVINKIF